MKTVVISLLGVTLDLGYKHSRWNRWRPSVSLCSHDDLLIDRFEMLHQEEHTKLANFIAEDINHVSPETIVRHTLINQKDPWDFQEVYSTLYEFATSYNFDTDNEQYLIHITTGTHVAQICLFLLNESHYLPGKLIQSSPIRSKKGETGNVSGEYTIIDLDLSKYDILSSRFEEQANDDISFLKFGVETKNRAFNRQIEKIERVALHSIDPILLTGPTGSGKSRLAKRIYALKKNKLQVSGPFVELNCASLCGSAALSALFGHKKGAFTGAVSDRDGALKKAHGGILFLDEIGELGLDEQAILLKAIEEKLFLPLGSDTETSSDFQLICGTNRDLTQSVLKGEFREDLLARINLWTFELPALKDRLEDIEPNLQFELNRYSEKYSKQIRFNRESKKQFLKFCNSPDALWRANFRDLTAAITRMSTLSQAGKITTTVVNEEIETLRNQWSPYKHSDTKNSLLLEVIGDQKYQEIDPFDRPQLEEVIRVCRESKTISEAGRKLFAVSRQKKAMTNDSDRLRKYLQKFGLSWAKVQ